MGDSGGGPCRSLMMVGPVAAVVVVCLVCIRKVAFCLYFCFFRSAVMCVCVLLGVASRQPARLLALRFWKGASVNDY